jgi:hypothetical protein
VAERNADAADPVTFAGGLLDRCRHVCAFTHSEPELDAVLDPFVKQGVDQGDRLLFLVDPARAAGPLTRLRHLGFGTEGLLADHRCEVHTWTDTYLRGGEFDENEMLGLLEDMLAVRKRPRVRLIADMGWAAQRGDVAHDLIEFESRANFIHARHSHVVVCIYDLKRFDGAFVIDVLRTHPFVLIGGLLQENPFFVPPPEFLEERARLLDV